VNSSSLVDTTGLGALEFLLFNTEPNPCALGAPPSAAQRAAYAVRVADRILLVANDLVNRWDPAGGNFLTQWRTAGAGSAAFAIPQDALDALSVALFYLEKDTKDDKIADPTGIGATGLTACPTVSCPERLESRLSRHSGENVRVNAQAFLDVFAGVNGGMGMNDLLRGIGRDDLADDVAAALQAVLDHVSNNVPDFDTAVEDIDDETACINASSNPMPNVEPACSLHGYIKQAMDIFRVEIVAALSLATPNRAAGDND
jgi:predicted lipoprotein